MLTRIDDWGTGNWYKRDDLACHGVGAKGRQYLKMIESQPEGLPLVVGCAATSAMQLYIAAMHKATGRRAVVFTAGRKVKTRENLWAESRGVEVNYVRPGYMTGVRKAAREWAKANGGAVRWVPKEATVDTAYQVQNIPPEAKRIVLAVGSGAAAVGVLIGLMCYRTVAAMPDVLGVAVSGMADARVIMAQAEAWLAPLLYEPYQQPDYAAKYLEGVANGTRPRFEMVAHPFRYDKPIRVDLPSGDPLDPYYAAKAAQYLEPGDGLWIVGCRPRSLFT